MTQRDEYVELPIIDGVGLRTTFVWRDDRYAHVIALVDRTGEHPLLTSLEGSPDNPWPPSPAFQQLSMQGEAAQRVALLVGMAGKSHWSMSVETSATRRDLVFDVACRLNEAEATLGSCYLAKELTLTDAFTATGRINEHRYTLSFDRALSQDIQPLSMLDDQIRIRHLAADTPLPCTARWKYVVTLL